MKQRIILVVIGVALVSCGDKPEPAQEAAIPAVEPLPELDSSKPSPAPHGSSALETATAVIDAIPTSNRPIGWEGMTPAEQSAFAQLATEIRDTLDSTNATDEEWAAMTQPERRALMRQKKENIAAMSKRMEDSGFEIDPNVPRQIVDNATGGGGSAPDPVFQIAAHGAGTIKYDTGTSAGTTGIASQMVGNRFDSALNQAGTACCFSVGTSGTITQITFNMANTFFGSAVVSIYSNIAGTMANQVTSMARPGIMTGLNTLAVMTPTTMNAYANGAFLAGIWQFDPTMTGLAVDANTTGMQGYHAISLNDGAAGSMLATIASRNAIFRVKGQNLVPVELMKFESETVDTKDGGSSDPKEAPKP